MKASEYPLKKNIQHNIITISRCTSTLLDNLAEHKFGISRGQFVYITHIVEYPGCSQDDICRMLKLNKASVSKALDKLDMQGHILRRKSENDKRVNRVYPTDELKELYSYIYAEAVRLSKILFEGFTKEEVGTANSLMIKAKKNINKYWLEVYKYDVKYANEE